MGIFKSKEDKNKEEEYQKLLEENLSAKMKGQNYIKKLAAELITAPVSNNKKISNLVTTFINTYRNVEMVDRTVFTPVEWRVYIPEWGADRYYIIPRDIINALASSMLEKASQLPEPPSKSDVLHFVGLLEWQLTIQESLDKINRW